MREILAERSVVIYRTFPICTLHRPRECVRPQSISKRRILGLCIRSWQAPLWFSVYLVEHDSQDPNAYGTTGFVLWISVPRHALSYARPSSYHGAEKRPGQRLHLLILLADSLDGQCSNVMAHTVDSQSAESFSQNSEQEKGV